MIGVEKMVKSLTWEELLKKQHYYLQVFFQRPSEELLQDKRYRYVIFSHVGIYAPYFGSIYEVTGQCLAIAQQSADIYLPKNCVRLILPISLVNEVKVRNILEKHLTQYTYCVPYVVNVLKDLKVLEKDYKADGVDELFLELQQKFRISTETIKDHFNREKQ